MENQQHKIKQIIKERAAARKRWRKKPATVKSARTMDAQKHKQAQSRRQSMKAKQEAMRRKVQARRLTPSVPKASLDPETQARLDETQRELNDLQDDIMLTTVHNDMGQIESILTNLGVDLKDLRTKGYAFRSYLENKINVLTDKWEDISEQIDDEVEEQSDKLEREADEAEDLVQQAIGGDKNKVSRAEAAVQSLQRKANSARQSLRNRYDDVSQTIHQTRTQLDEVQWAFEQAEQSTIEFLEAEYLIAACRAKMLEKPDEDEGAEGVLYLTDERLIFEQKEKIATKKFLFVTTASETVQEVDFETLLDWIEDAEVQDKKKFLSTKELLTLRLSPESSWSSVTFRLLKGAKNEAWSQYLNRARSGEIDRERIAEAAEEKEKLSTQVSEAPTVCSMCAAPLPTAIARGQGEITCEYCGTVVRL